MRIISVSVLVFLFIATTIISFTYPAFIASNTFITDFVSNQFISFLAVIVAITFASTESIHLHLSSIEKKLDEEDAFLETRNQINLNIYGLITLLFVAISLLIYKGSFVAPSLETISLVNGYNLLILIAYMFCIIDLLLLVTDIARYKSNNENR